LRIRVTDVLELLASGMSREEILLEYPALETDDFDAVLVFAAAMLNRPFVLPIPGQSNSASA
jgi:uncharacterized protein (DUF433 family)